MTHFILWLQVDHHALKLASSAVAIILVLIIGAIAISNPRHRKQIERYNREHA